MSWALGVRIHSATVTALLPMIGLERTAAAPYRLSPGAGQVRVLLKAFSLVH